MGATKKHFYPEDQLLFSNFFKALGHPARLAIVEMLSKNDHLNCTDLNQNLQLSQASISRHCQILFECGIVGSEVIQNNCFYRIDNRVLDQLSGFISEVNAETPSISNKVYYPANRASI